MSDKRETLAEAIRRLASAEQAAQNGELPAPEDLVAYRDGKLSDTAREKLEQKLALDSLALREYLDLVDPAQLKASEEWSSPSDEEVGQAFASLKCRVEKGAEKTADQGSTSIAITSSSQENSRRSRRRLWASAVAAAVILVIAGLWIYRLQQSLLENRGPRFAVVLDVHPTRGARPTPVSKNAGEILLVFHDVDLGTHSKGQLEVLAIDGRRVLLEEILPSADEGSLLYLPISKVDLPYGRYQVQIFGVGRDRRQLVQEYSLNLVSPDSDSRQ